MASHRNHILLKDDAPTRLGERIRIALFPVLSVFIGVLVLTGMALADEKAPQSSDCLECHDVVTGNEKHSYDGLLKESIHEDIECLDCHDAIKELPHDDVVPPVNCGLCHEDVVEAYVCHGGSLVGEDGDIPTCSDCHGKHDILAVDDSRARVSPRNLPETCGRCHENIDLTTKHDIPFDKAVEVYRSSVHGHATLGGVNVPATCIDCHAPEDNSHEICPPGRPDSPINHFNIPKTCGKCHRAIESDYYEGIHGKLTKRGETGTPVCTDCHGEHGIFRASDPRSPVSPIRLAEATCAPCHESARLNEKYGIPIDRLQTFIDTYHGLKSEAGDIAVANCASCHGAHRILPSTDSTSSIYAGNLVKTCGHCHPGISRALATAPVHGTPGITQTSIANYVRTIYLIAIAVIVGLMTIHGLLDLRKHIKLITKERQVSRMSLNELWQHTFLMVTFIVLVISGFSLRFSDAWWPKFLFGREGGFAIRGIIHRAAAVLFVITVIWHTVYLTTAKGRQFLRDMWPTKKDFKQFSQMIKYNLGLAEQRPRFGRFSYVEKAEYWALVWGSLVMIVTGILLWFDNFAAGLLPKGFLDVMLVVHYYEAWLATLSILIWHLYSTVFNPAVYPMNPAWLNGKMPQRMHEHEHPDDQSIPRKPDKQK